jgi:hypothetical protein
VSSVRIETVYHRQFFAQKGLVFLSNMNILNDIPFLIGKFIFSDAVSCFLHQPKNPLKLLLTFLGTKRRYLAYSQAIANPARTAGTF